MDIDLGRKIIVGDLVCFRGSQVVGTQCRDCGKKFW